MNSKNFVIDVLDRVLACEERLRSLSFLLRIAEGLSFGDDRGGSGCSSVPTDCFVDDAAATFLMLMSLHGTTCLSGDKALSFLNAFADFDIMLTAGRMGRADRNAVCDYLLAQGKSHRVSMSERLNSLKAKGAHRSPVEFPLDDFGHGPRWYAKLFARIRPRQAAEYIKLDAILKRLGYPEPEERDSEGLTLDDYLASVLPARSEYLAIELPASKGGRCEVRYLDREEGEMLSRANEKSSRLLFRLVDGGRKGRDAYLGVFPLTNGQVRAINGGEEEPSSSRDLPWAEHVKPCIHGDEDFKKYVAVCEKMVHALRKLTGLVSVDIPGSRLWERACRAGTSTRFNGGSDDEMSCLDLGWTAMNSGLVSHPVGQKRPNALGLYDCHGNVSECCREKVREGFEFVARGGSFEDMPFECGSPAVRSVHGPCGLRLAIYL